MAAAAPTCIKLTGISPLTADLLRAHWHSMEYLGHLSLFYASVKTNGVDISLIGFVIAFSAM